VGGDAVPFAEAAEQEVLGTDEVVVEQAGLLLGEHEDPATAVGEALEHDSGAMPG
jgi:hypothetical protein